MTLSDRLIAQTKSAGIRAGAHARVEQLLSRYNLQYIATEGCWVLLGGSLRVYVDGPNWVMYYAKDKDAVHTGAGTVELGAVLETICG